MTAMNLNELVSMQDILKTAIERERQAHEFYLQAKEQARTLTEEKMFAELAAEELHHQQILEQKLTDIQAQIDIDRALSFDVY